MSFPVPTTSSDYKTVVAAATTFDTTMADGEDFVFSSSTDCFIKQGAAPAASAADGSSHVGAGQRVLIHGDLGAKLSVIRVAADGHATLTRLKFIR